MDCILDKFDRFLNFCYFFLFYNLIILMKTKIILKIDNVIRVVDLEIVIPLHTKKYV